MVRLRSFVQCSKRDFKPVSSVTCWSHCIADENLYSAFTTRAASKETLTDG